MHMDDSDFQTLGAASILTKKVAEWKEAPTENWSGYHIFEEAKKGDEICNRAIDEMVDVLGKGIAVIPSKGEVVAPCDAVVETVFDTKHAVGLSTESGMELLIHIGINTVELNGKYFTSHVKNGDHVKKGQLLVSFDMEKVKAAGYDVTTPLIVTNSDDYKDVKILSEDSVTPSDKVLEIVK